MFHTSEQKTAILVFAHSAKEEIRRKGISKGLDLFSELNARILAEVKKTELPYFHLSEELQTGQTFGQRFANAIALVFANGFERVIAIGNDSPQLKSRHLLVAEDCLNQGKSVVGPSLDGGFYLLGLKKEHFDKAIFTQFSWQKTSLLREITSYLNQLGVFTEKLNYLFDIDSAHDIKLLLKTTFGSIHYKLRGLMANVLSPIRIDAQQLCNLLRPNHCRLCDLVRGSP